MSKESPAELRIVKRRGGYDKRVPMESRSLGGLMRFLEKARLPASSKGSGVDTQRLSPAPSYDLVAHRPRCSTGKINRHIGQ
jgi:hypothetical protein